MSCDEVDSTVANWKQKETEPDCKLGVQETRIGHIPLDTFERITGRIASIHAIQRPHVRGPGRNKVTAWRLSGGNKEGASRRPDAANPLAKPRLPAWRSSSTHSAASGGSASRERASFSDGVGLERLAVDDARPVGVARSPARPSWCHRTADAPARPKSGIRRSAHRRSGCAAGRGRQLLHLRPRCECWARSTPRQVRGSPARAATAGRPAAGLPAMRATPRSTIQSCFSCRLT